MLREHLIDVILALTVLLLIALSINGLLVAITTITTTYS